ncbi:24950_t:CDS:1, partial [Gigaspora rosea]
HGLTGDYVMIGPLQRWYLLGGTPSFFRTLGFIKDFIVMTFKLYLTESLIKLWRLWYLYRSIDILGV